MVDRGDYTGKASVKPLVAMWKPKSQVKGIEFFINRGVSTKGKGFLGVGGNCERGVFAQGKGVINLKGFMLRELLEDYGSM